MAEQRMRLTPLGERTLEGLRHFYKSDQEAMRRFNKALEDGIFDRAKMQIDPLFNAGDTPALQTAERESAPKSEPAPAPHGLARGVGGTFQARPG